MKYTSPKMDFLLFLSEEQVLLITSSKDTSDQMNALWSDGFSKKDLS